MANNICSTRTIYVNNVSLDEAIDYSLFSIALSPVAEAGVVTYIKYKDLAVSGENKNI